ncbi:MAG: SPASM domain-containing protein [Defluviitaleaceae bacterium]|nr:SPASM domain-containing protein [Defluviitaleaceae bacterium]
MKASRYNFFFPYEPDDSRLIAYNSLSNALAIIDKIKHNELQQYIDSGIEISDIELVNNLKAGGFLISAERNELDVIKLRMLKSRYNTNALGLTIVPTADCCFRCLYCYEKDVIKPIYMTPEVEDAIVNLAESYIRVITSFRVNWYGGEPLMNIGSVERLSRRLMEMCERHNVAYHADMVTNGYLLTREIAQLLVELKVSSLQITLDGCEDVHNERRPHTDGSGTFSVILSNLIASKDILPDVSLRINVDKSNITAGGDISKIIDEHGLKGKVQPYLGRVMDEKHENASCFDSCGFSREEFKYFSEFTDTDMYMRHYPIAMKNYCGADYLNSYVIGADGKLYKCWLDIGDDARCTGSLIDGVDANESLYMSYLLNDPTVDEDCNECKLLPVCMGGCPHKRIIKNEGTCSTFKFVLADLLKVITRNLKLQKDLGSGVGCDCADCGCE